MQGVVSIMLMYRVSLNIYIAYFNPYKDEAQTALVKDPVRTAQ